MFDDSGEDHEDPFGMEEGPPPEEELGPDPPEVDGPEIPSVEAPSVDVDYEDVPPDILRTFWILVLIANAGLLAFSLGVMFVIFRGNWDLGARLVVASGLLAILGWRVYSRFER
jgi:hypothetical protein